MLTSRLHILRPVAAVVALTAIPAGPASVERTAWLMGTRATVFVEAEDRASALAASEVAISAMSAAEARLSTWRDDSDMARLNRVAPGDVGDAPPALRELLAEVAAWSERTGGAFHPVVGALVDAWDLRGEGRVPTSDELRRALDASGASGVSIDPETGEIVRSDEDAWLDAGAFGKGAALREAQRALAGAGVQMARIDLGGQILVVGDPPVSVAVAHPVHRDRPLFELRLRDVSVATSGQSERGIDVDGIRFGHLLDPRDGRPVPAWGSVTVVHPDPVAADILSTAFFVLGPDDGLRLAESLDVGALFLVVDDAGVSERMTPALRRNQPIRSISAFTSNNHRGLPQACVPFLP